MKTLDHHLKRMRTLDRVLDLASQKINQRQYMEELKAYRSQKQEELKESMEANKNESFPIRLLMHVHVYFTDPPGTRPILKDLPQSWYIAGVILLLFGRCSSGLLLNPEIALTDSVFMMILLLLWYLRDRLNPSLSVPGMLLTSVLLLMSFFELGNPLNLLPLAGFAVPGMLSATSYLYPASILVIVFPIRQWIPVPEYIDIAWFCFVLMLAGYALIWFCKKMDPVRSDIRSYRNTVVFLYSILAAVLGLSALLHLLMGVLTNQDPLSFWVMQLHPLRILLCGLSAYLLINPNLPADFLLKLISPPKKPVHRSRKK
jgi:hypothetical protein